MIIPGFLLVLVFLVENVRQIYFGEPLKEGSLCKFYAFIAIFTVTSLNGASSTVAYVTYLFVKHGKTPSKNPAIFGNLLIWLMGIVIAFVYLSGNVFGPYRGIYCCVKKEHYNGILVAEMFLVFAFSVGLQSFFYWRAFLESRRHSRSQINAGSTSLSVMRSGLEMIFIFYTSYSLIAADAVAVFSSAQTSIWLSVVASCMVKLQPFCHCILFHGILKKIHQNNAQVHPVRALSTGTMNKTRFVSRTQFQLLKSSAKNYLKYVRKGSNMYSRNLEDIKSPEE